MTKELNKKTKIDTFSYKGWLISDNFLKRAFAVCGYYWVATALIYFCILAVILLFVLILGLS